ncbi:hypothetical protein V6N13_109482 [Hibiscus sabdariffa]
MHLRMHRKANEGNNMRHARGQVVLSRTEVCMHICSVRPTGATTCLPSQKRMSPRRKHKNEHRASTVSRPQKRRGHAFSAKQTRWSDPKDAHRNQAGHKSRAKSDQLGHKGPVAYVPRRRRSIA